MSSSAWPWALGAAAFWLVADVKIVRGKLLAVEACAILAAAVLLARGGKPRRSSADAAALALAGAAILFWALSPEKSASEGEAVRLLFCALTAWAASRSAAEKPEELAALWTAGAAAASAWALIQLGRGQERPFASFGNPIFLGTALAAAVPLALGLAREDAPRRPLWAGAAALETAALLATRSRAAAFGLLAALALWALARLNGKERARALAGLAAAAGLAAWAYRGREWTHGLIWRDALSLWSAHPLLGAGLGRFHLEFPSYASEALRAKWAQGAVVINYAHNEYLQTLAETGPLGLAALLCAPAAAWAALRRESGARAACAAGALALFSAALVSPDLRFGASAFAAFALLGAACPAAPGGRAVPPALGACALAAFAYLAARPALAVRRNAAEAPFQTGADAGRVMELQDRLARSPSDADAAEELGFLKAKAGDLRGAAEAFQAAARLAPARPGPLNNLGNIAYLSGDLDGAIAWWEKSLAAAPAQIDARINLAKLLCERGRLKPCAAHLEEVLRRDPSNAKARVLYKKMVE